MLDEGKAVWLADLIVQASTNLEESPGLTVEVVGQSEKWIQVLPECQDENGRLSGFVVNFAYHNEQQEPVATIEGKGIRLPPGTRTLEWEGGAYARLWIRPDVPVVGLAHLMSDILERISQSPANPELEVHIEYGY